MRAIDRQNWTSPWAGARRWGVALLLGLLALPVAPPAGEGQEAGAQEPLARLKAGNERFMRGERQVIDLRQARAEGAAGQRPFATILACSDSRVPPEIVFDASLGQLFIVRVAGNVADAVVLGSIEYAAEVLKSPLLVVMGHEQCGAVKAAAEGGQAPPNIGAILERIAPAVERVKRRNLGAEATMHAAVEENVRLQLANVLDESSMLRAMVRKGELRLAGAVYDLPAGNVAFLPDPPKAP